MKKNSYKNNIGLILLLIIAHSKTDMAQGNWERLDSPTTENLTAVHFVDSLFGWASGFSGTIIHTTNGGNDWLMQDSKTNNNIVDIFFISRDIGWAAYLEGFNVPFGTYILKTTNGGENWISSNYPLENFFSKCLLFNDSLNGWMGGIPYPIVRTTDGGDSWIEAVIDSSTFSYLPVYDIQFYNSKFGYASGGKIDCCGVIWSTTNGGNNWKAIDPSYVSPEPIYQLYYYDSLNVLGVGGDFESLGYGVGMNRTSNGGNSWEFEYIGLAGVAWDIDFRNESEAWAPLGGEQKLIFSLDSGFSWTPVTTPDSSMIFKLIFPDSLHGFGVGSNGTIIKYQPNIVSAANTKVLNVEGFLLKQNYPNPFNSTTNIRYSIPENGFINLAVYNLLGEEIALLVNEQQEASNYDIWFNAENLPSGIYIYCLNSSSFSIARKMILLR